MAEINTIFSAVALPGNRRLRSLIFWAHQFIAGPFLWQATVSDMYWLETRGRRGPIGAGVWIFNQSSMSDSTIEEALGEDRPRILIPLLPGEIWTQEQETSLNRYRCQAIFIIIFPRSAGPGKNQIGRRVNSQIVPPERVEGELIPAVLRH